MTRRFAALLFLALALRLALAITAPTNPDMGIWGGTVGQLNAGGRLFDNPFYPYSPLISSILVAIDHLRGAMPLPIAVRLVLSIVDMANVGLVYAITRKRSAALAYAFNPQVILVCAARGQFETMLICPTLLAVYLVSRYVRNRVKAQRGVPDLASGGVGSGVSAGADSTPR